MSDPDETGRGDENRDPEDTFALVGNEVRAAILEALGDSWEPGEERPTVSFSDLRDRVAVDVRSSRFNYHLQQLVGQYVEDADEGYRLRPAGEALYRSIRADTFARDVELDPFEVGVDCHRCGAAVTARYDMGQFTVRCPDCEHRYLDSTRVPPSGVADESALLSRVHRHDRHKLHAFTQGVCPTCANDLDRRLLRPEDAAFGDGEASVYVFHACDHCGNQDYRTVGEALLFRPELVCFFAERGLDVTTTPTWELPFAATDDALTVESSDPWRVRLALERAGDVRELVVDGSLDVVEVRDE